MTTATTEKANPIGTTSSFSRENTPFSRLPKVINPLNTLNLLTLRGLALALLLIYFATQLTIAQNDILAAVLASSLGLILVSTLIITLLWGRILKSSLSISSLHALSTEALRASPSSAVLSSRLFKSSSSLISKSSTIQAGVSSVLTLSLSHLIAPPFYKLRAKISLSDGFSDSINFIRASTEIMAGDDKPDSGSTAIFRLQFPHRGQWRIEQIEFTLTDRFGLTKKRWSISEYSLAQGGGVLLAVDPANPPRESANFPIIASRDREGDTLNQSNTRLGEPFDLKRYNPSDGLKKVVWKVFARSGELISRHPESAMTPEGECYIFVVAGPNAAGDQVVRHALDYCNALEEAGVDLRLGCAGSLNEDTATCSSQALAILRRSAWIAAESKKPQAFLSRLRNLFFGTEPAETALGKTDPKKIDVTLTRKTYKGTSKANNQALNTVTNQAMLKDHQALSLSLSLREFLSQQPVNPPIQRLILFLSPLDQNEETQIIEALLELERASISPVLMVISPSSALPLDSYVTNHSLESAPIGTKDGESKMISRLISWGKTWFFSNDSAFLDSRPQVTYLSLLKVGAQRGWQIYIDREPHYHNKL